MRYVILRDDDTNSLTPISKLELLYRPFLDAGLPVNLATIPNVDNEATLPDGTREVFLPIKLDPSLPRYNPIGNNKELVKYLKNNRGYTIAQHGYHHEFHEFNSVNKEDISNRLNEGLRFLQEAGFPKPTTFIAPQDKLSKVSIKEITKRFPILSTNWYEINQIPSAWWPAYLWKKLRNNSHWKVGETILLSRPRGPLSKNLPLEGMVQEFKNTIAQRKLTVIINHYWEYFDGDKPNEPFVKILHHMCDYLKNSPDIKVISFNDLLHGFELN